MKYLRQLMVICGFVTGSHPTLLEGAVPAVITEILAINQAGLTDEDGDPADWIEIHNPGTTAINLQNWTLTDDPSAPNRWRFPTVEIPAGGFLVVFASDKDRATPGRPLHTNFKLKGGGDYLALVRPDGSLADAFDPAYPDQKADVSYGLTAGGGRDYLLRPTPGQPNAGARKGRVAAVRPSRESGFFDEPWSLELATATEGAEIRFTRDGSEPSPTHGERYAGPLRIAGTTALRVAAFKEGHAPSGITSLTFLFPADVVRQSADGLPPAGWPYSWGPNEVDYGMDPKVVEDRRFRDEIVPALTSLPSISIIMDLDDLFGARDGIYANAGRDGRETEKPASVEYLRPDGKEGFRIDAGIRIRGGFSRMPMNPKHAFRLFFRKEYGPGKLRYPLFGPGAAQEFDNLDLRTFQNYSWSFQADPRGVFLRDQFNRDLQLALGRPAARGDFCHLYLNGMYWGLYDTCERPEASFGATYFGGNKEDYDVIKVNSGFGERGMNGFGTISTDGNMEAWKQLNDLAREGLGDDARYQRLLGRNPDGSRNPDFPVLLDPDNLIDYMLVIFYGGNLDAPITKFGGNSRPNNWYGIRNRKGDLGFRFFVWDAEHTFLDLNEDRTGPFPAGRDLETSNPQWLWQQCLDNPEFRSLVADHIHRHFFNGGVLTAANVAKRFRTRAAEIESAVIGESARWGDRESGFPMGAPARLSASGEPLTGPLNRDDDWRTERDRILNEYMTRRSDVVLAQLYGQGLVSDLPVPQVKASAAGLSLSVGPGEAYYTVDGTDPRRVGGGISAAARKGTGPIAAQPGLTLRARTFLNGEWSPILEYPGPLR